MRWYRKTVQDIAVYIVISAICLAVWKTLNLLAGDHTSVNISRSIKVNMIHGNGIRGNGIRGNWINGNWIRGNGNGNGIHGNGIHGNGIQGTGRDAEPEIGDSNEDDRMDEEQNEDENLEKMYMDRLTKSRITDIPEVEVVKTQDCSRVSNAEYPCTDRNCTGSIRTVGFGSLRNFIETQSNVPTKYLNVIKGMRNRIRKHKIILVTATSDNHFMESLMFLKNVQEVFLPNMANFDFGFALYDLGLTPEQRSNIEEICQCEVRDFPLESFPKRMQRLKCYTWKPIIIAANLPMAEYLLWADSSVRFTNTNMAPFLKQIRSSGIMVSKIIRALGQHFAPQMMHYYGDQPCQYSPYWEFEANFIGFHNDVFVRKAIIKPWLTCAFAPDCMCPEGSQNMIKCNIHVRKYNKCHRFDQASLNIILIKLFQENMRKMTMPKSLFHDIKRGDRIDKHRDVKVTV